MCDKSNLSKLDLLYFEKFYNRKKRQGSYESKDLQLSFFIASVREKLNKFKEKVSQDKNKERRGEKN